MTTILDKAINKIDSPCTEKKINLIYYFVLAILLMLYGHNDNLNLFVLTTVTFLFLIYIKKDEFLYSYFPIIFFEQLLVLPFVEGSYFRVYQALFIIRILFDLINNKRLYPFSSRLNISAGVIFIFLSFLYLNNLEAVASMAINVLIVLYILLQTGRAQKHKFYNDVFAVIGIFTAFSGVYGLFFGSATDYGFTSRVSGIIGDPNYSALFYTLGIFSILGTDSINRNIKKVIVIILLLLLLLTLSISGIVGATSLFILYKWFQSKRKGLLVTSFVILIFSIFLSTDYERGSTLYGLKHRITFILETTDLNVITSSRSSLASNYLKDFKELPLNNVLFGGKNVVSGEYRDVMVGKYGQVSHNSYIDMLFMVGILGSIIILFFFIYMIHINLIRYRRTSKEVYLSLSMLKITILYFSISLSIFPFRYFYTFLLI